MVLAFLLPLIKYSTGGTPPETSLIVILPVFSPKHFTESTIAALIIGASAFNLTKTESTFEHPVSLSKTFNTYQASPFTWGLKLFVAERNCPVVEVQFIVKFCEELDAVPLRVV